MKRKLATLALSLCAAAALWAEETAAPITVTVDRAVELAMENNIQLQSSAIDLRIKERSKKYALNVFIPTVQATGSLVRQNNVSNPYAPILSQIIPGYVAESPSESDHWMASAGLSFGLNLNMALLEGLRATRQNYDAGKLTYEQARAQTEQNVRKAFYGILLQEGSLALAKGKLAASEDRMNQTRINYSNGLVPELVYLQTQLAVETQKPAIREAEIALDEQRKLFAFLIGLPTDATIVLDGKIDPEMKTFDASSLVEEHLADRFDIALLAKNIEMMETQIKATKLQTYTPSIALSQSFSPVKSDISSPWLDSDSWTDNSGAFSITLAFNLTNILPFSPAGVALAEQKDAARKIELALAQAKINARVEIEALVQRLEKARTSVAAMELNVSIAEKAYRLTEQGYRAGTIEYLDLKDAENDLLQARLGVLTEKFNYLNTLLDLEAALNAKLSTEK